MGTILPKHAFEAYTQLLELDKEYSSYQKWASDYFQSEKSYSTARSLQIGTYIEMLLLVTACLDGDINQTEAKAIRFILDTKQSYQTASKRDLDFIKKYPPALIYNAFAYQNETNTVVLPDILKHIKTIIDYIDQLNYNSNSAELYDGLVELYKSALERKTYTSNTLDKTLREANPDTESIEDDEPHEDPMIKLNNMIGLTQIKKDVSALVDLIKLREIRKSHGLSNPDMSFHMVFSGNPGTGKTTVARLLADVYKSYGIVSKGQFVETDRVGLVGSYVGQTANKVHDVVDSAIGGVLFIDEAYSLNNKSEVDYGKEAIDTLLKLMEDNRNDLIVIVAGYTDLMEDFLDSNPGLRSRFNKKFAFPDYTESELYEIFEGMCTQNNYTLSEDSKLIAKKYFSKMVQNKDQNFGNARDVRNFFERIMSNQASRIVKLSSPSKIEVETLLPEDFH